MENLYALIMAGGGGTRLWPLSRKDRPKQMLRLLEDRTMFQIAVERLAPLLPPDRIFVVTGRDQADQLRRDAPQVPPDRFIVEPFGQNTGPSVGLATLHIRRRAPGAVIAILAADHHIVHRDRFCRVLAAAGELAARGYLVTLGVAPTSPVTGYGYIKQGDALGAIGEFQTYHVAGFVEKPDLETAGRFLAEGTYSWNSGMFIATADRLLDEYARHQPEMAALLREIDGTIGRDNYQATLDRVWPQMPRLSIDYAIIEGAGRMAMIPAEIGWSDIGSWAALFDLLEGDRDGNVVRGQEPGHIRLDTKDSLIFSDRLVAAIGLEGLVIVDTDDVLLVCRRDRAQDVRRVVDELKANGQEQFL